MKPELAVTYVCPGCGGLAVYGLAWEALNGPHSMPIDNAHCCECGWSGTRGNLDTEEDR